MASENGGSARCGRRTGIVGPKSHEAHMIHRRWFIALFLSCFAIASQALADFAGKVVGVSDGDTLTVLRDRTEVRMLVYRSVPVLLRDRVAGPRGFRGQGGRR